MSKSTSVRVSEPGELLLYDGELFRVVGIAEGRSIILDPVEESPCGRCEQPRRLHMLEHSPLFQDHVEPVKTVEAR